jgi:hypothetical protein
MARDLLKAAVMNRETSLSFAASALLVTVVLFACAGAEAPDPSLGTDDDASADAGYGGTSVIPSSSFDAGSSRDDGGSYGYGYPSPDGAPCPRDANASESHDAAPPDEASREASLLDGDDDAYACNAPLAPGDLMIDELMIASASGSSDHGEWVEVMSTRDCALDLAGLYAQVPHGKGTTVASITMDVWLPPHGFFLIADSADPSENNDLPGLVFTWGAGTSSNVLDNSGDTLTLYTAEATIDALTYPASSKLVEGSSMAFPSDCDPALRAAFGNWQPSITSWTPGFFGTPSAPNTDVTCPVLPPPSMPSGAPCAS